MPRELQDLLIFCSAPLSKIWHCAEFSYWDGSESFQCLTSDDERAISECQTLITLIVLWRRPNIILRHYRRHSFQDRMLVCREHRTKKSIGNDNAKAQVSMVYDLSITLFGILHYISNVNRVVRKWGTLEWQMKIPTPYMGNSWQVVSTWEATSGTNPAFTFDEEVGDIY